MFGNPLVREAMSGMGGTGNPFTHPVKRSAKWFRWLCPDSLAGPHGLWSYIRTRILTARIAGLWLLVVLACRGAAGSVGLASSVWTIGMTGLSIVALRLWDDLTDRDFDRHHHPERVLSRCPDIGVYQAVLGASLMLMALFIGFHQGASGLLPYGLVLCFLAVVYRFRGAWDANRTVRTQLVLLKYPAIVYLFADPTASRLWPSALGLYLVLSLVDWRDEHRTRSPARSASR